MSKRLLVGAAILAAFARGSIWWRFRADAAAPPPPPRPPDLNPWDFLGCQRLQFDRWVPEREGEEPPMVRTLLFVADSVDEFGRAMDGRRALPLEVDEGLAREGLEALWFTRADTLWLVWSNAEMRAAVALRRSRDGMTGRAVAAPRAAARSGGEGEAQAPAAAWAVNCHSGRPNRITPVDR